MAKEATKIVSLDINVNSIFSAIIYFFLTIIEASTTRSPLVPRTRSSESTTAFFEFLGPMAQVLVG